MTISFLCPDCQKRFDVDDKLSGKKGRCTCGKVFSIPVPKTVSQPAPVPEASLLEDLPPADPLANTSWVDQDLPPDSFASDPLQPVQQQYSANYQPSQSGYRRQRKSGGHGSATVVFVGHQLALWSRIGTLLALLLILISLIIKFSADSPSLIETSSTMVDIARYVMLAAGIVALVGIGLFLALPIGTTSWGVALASLIVCSIGGVMGAILLVKETGHKKSFVIITVLIYFAGSIMISVLLKVLASRHRDEQSGNLAIGGIVLGAVTPLFFLLFLFLAGKQFLMTRPKPPSFPPSIASSPEEVIRFQEEYRQNQQNAMEKARSFGSRLRLFIFIGSLLFILLWAASVGLEMATLGSLWTPLKGR